MGLGVWVVTIAFVLFLFVQDIALMSEFFLDFATLNRIKLVMLALLLAGATLLSYGLVKGSDHGP